MPKVRFTDKAMKKFNGYYGQHMFIDGVSEHSLNKRDIDMLSAIVQIVAIDEDGGESFCGVAHDMVSGRRVGAVVSEPLKVAGEASFKAEENQPPVEPVQVKTEQDKTVETLKSEVADLDAEIEASEAAADNKTSSEGVYTKEDLEKIADENGIKGLREIAEPLGVKNVSIEGLIAEIIKAQETAA